MLLVIGIINLLISLAILLLGLFVLSRNTKRRVNQIFGSMILASSMWIISSSLADLVASIEWALFWTRAAIVGPFLFCAFFLYFTYYFPDTQIRLGRFKTLVIFGIPILALLLVPTKYNVESVSFKSWGTDFTPGILYPILSVVLILYIGSGLYNLFNSYKAARSQRERAQVFYVFLGIFSVVVVGASTNLISPLFFDFAQLSVFGPSIAIFIFAGLTSYAILVHHLLEIWLVIRLGAIFTLLFAVISIVYVGTISLLTQYIASIYALLLASLLITLTFEPLKRFIENKTDKFFFRKHYHVEEVINEITVMAHKLELNLNKISEAFVKIVKRQFKVGAIGIAIRTPRGSFMLNMIYDDRSRGIELEPDNQIVSFLSANPNFIFNLDDITRSINSQEINLPVEQIELVPLVYEELLELGAVIALPIEFESQLIGINFIGRKKSGDFFTYQDLKLLDHLTGEVGGLINNARLYEDLKKLDEAKSNFISVVSHQLRTPLSAMRWSMEMMQDDDVSKKMRKEFLDDAYRKSLFVISHLDDMLVALDIDRGDVDCKKELCNLQDLISDILERNRNEIKSKKLEMNISISDVAKKLYSDCRKLDRILSILINNTIKYSFAGGGIIIDVRKKAENNKDWIEVSIFDEGIGISRGEQGYLFEKFFRGEEAKKASPNGFGLGLFIAKAFIEAHGGKIWFESDGRGKGSKFYLLLPADKTQNK